MNQQKQKALEKAGFRVGSAADFLGLTEEERRMVELRLLLGRTVRTLRESSRLTQQDLARRIQSSQSRVAKLEAASAGVSLDLMFRGLFAVGGSLSDLAIEPDRPTPLKGRVPRRKKAPSVG
jgi:hypothetical protein